MVRIAPISNRYSHFIGLPQATLRISSRHRRGDVYFDTRSGPTTGRTEFQKGRARAGCSKSNGGYEAQAAAIRKRTAQLKALRLAKEAQGLVSDRDR
jgi:hypothetical protein